MKRLILIAVLCTFVAVPTLAGLHGEGWDGGTASWTRVSNEFDGRGGEFTLYPSTTGSLLLSNSPYASTTKGQDGNSKSFQTFCLEADEYIDAGMRIWVSESSVNADGSTNAYGSGSHAWQGGVNTNLGDNLDFKTAYLYTQFARGNLSGYTYGATPPGGLTRAQTAGALQRLIWATEGEGGNDFTASFMGVALNTPQRDLIAAWGTAYDVSGWTGIGDVRVLQLYCGGTASNPQFKQDQLFLTPVPGAVLLGLLGLGAAGVKLRKYA